jgi:hypothetical protein
VSAGLTYGREQISEIKLTVKSKLQESLWDITPFVYLIKQRSVRGAPTLIREGMLSKNSKKRALTLYYLYFFQKEKMREMWQNSAPKLWVHTCVFLL